MKGIWLAGALALLTTAAAHAEGSVERGAYLVRHVVACGNCHTDTKPGAPELAGGQRFATIAYTANAANLTPDKDTGMSGWTDEQFVDGLRNGKRPRGSTIGWPMPVEAYAHLSDDDAKSVVAFLRTLPPVNNKVARSTYRKPLPDAYGPPVKSVPEPAPAARGAYLATIAGCLHCHSTPIDEGLSDMKAGLGAGGREFRTASGQSLAPALRPAAIGHYSDADLKTIITTGTRPDGRKLAGPMPVSFFAGMTDEDVSAIIGYLRTLKD